MAKLDRLSPPGMDIRVIRGWTVGALIVGLLFSLMFLVSYFTELDERMQMMEYPVFEGLSMPYFEDLVYFPMMIFRAAPTVPLIFGIVNYRYFYEESKSIYIMRRLRSPMELHIRSWALPVLGALVVVAVGCAVYGGYWLIYRYVTPEILLPAGI